MAQCRDDLTKRVDRTGQIVVIEPGCTNIGEGDAIEIIDVIKVIDGDFAVLITLP